MPHPDREAVVVPKRSLSTFLAQCQRLATYPRVGGLYVVRVKVKKPASTPEKGHDVAMPDASGFPRQGAKR